MTTIMITIQVPEVVAGFLPAPMPTATPDTGHVPGHGTGSATSPWSTALAGLGLALAEDLIPGLGIAVAMGKLAVLALTDLGAAPPRWTAPGAAHAGETNPPATPPPRSHPALRSCAA